MKTFDIAVIEGDGIGPEVTREAMATADAKADATIRSSRAFRSKGPGLESAPEQQIGGAQAGRPVARRGGSTVSTGPPCGDPRRRPAWTSAANGGANLIAVR